ncbi:hypothetical protein CEXT_318591 [Caerostris extrusa]|uniref:Uncharacterized protein n=1 Tax=Caerostris extrusa TaxID=172846 RepID=A0AAV4RSQ7_CAEEX|nr:hypothetical protein CEXT_318591 [Caerostris extrusa]
MAMGAGGGRGGGQVKFICISSTLSGRLYGTVKRSPEKEKQLLKLIFRSILRDAFEGGRFVTENDEPVGMWD